MPINLDDPRVRKTRRGLQEAFVRLVLKIGYDAISIQAIADEAEAARVTFYRHYRDKEELLSDCLDQLYEGLRQRTERLDAAAWAQGITPVQVLYEHIEEQEALYRLLFSSRGTQRVIERLRHHMALHAIVGMKALPPSAQPRLPLDVIAHHVASAQIGLAMWWLEQGKPYPPRAMAQMATWLSLSGVVRALGLNVDVALPPTDEITT